ncbi:hypothetical protein SEA_DALANDE_104 [Gordonia phage DalanDe]|nr:hypothetical protein SEA_DALANDE_104 [Gordonia phage DalanDe]
MTTPTELDDDVLLIRGRVLSRTGQPRFRMATLVFQETAYDEEAEITRHPESVDIQVDPSTGRFATKLFPSTNGGGWVAKLVLVTFDGKVYTEYRTLPATGNVDYFQCPKATNMDAITVPTNAVPVLVADYNKPGGPLQLTTDGTIADQHIPPEFLRLDDERMPELANYVSKPFYEADQLTRNSITREFNNATVWEFEHGLPYRPLVECVETDGSVLIGAVTYPTTTTVVVEWDAPTTGTLIVR